MHVCINECCSFPELSQPSVTLYSHHHMYMYFPFFKNVRTLFCVNCFNFTLNAIMDKIGISLFKELNKFIPRMN